MDERKLVFLTATVSIGIVAAVLFGRYALSVQGLLTAAGILILGVVFFRGLNVKGLAEVQSAFYLSYIIVLLATWSPFKFLAYLSPILFLGSLILILSVSQNSIILRRTFALLFAWGVLTLGYLAINNDFEVQNSFISFFTYGSFFPILLIPSQWLANRTFYQKIATVTIIVLSFEAVYGIVQGGYGLFRMGSFAHAAGDFVEGTIHPGLSNSGGFNNPLFAFNMAFGLLLIGQQIAVGQRKYIIPLLLCSVAFVMAAVIHLILVFMIAAFLGLLFITPRLRDIPRRIRPVFAITVLAVPLLTVGLLQSNFQSINSRIRLITSNRNQKVELAKRVLWTMPAHYPAMRVVGLGPGQFSSRANLIGAGYLRQLPRPFKVVMTRSFEVHGIDLWMRHYSRPGAGSADRPASSWFSLIAEFGWLGAGVVIFAIARLLLIIRNHAKKTGQIVSAYFLCIGILFAFGSGATEYYWETCQAIFVGLMILKVLHANFKYGDDETTTPSEKSASSSTPTIERPQQAMLGRA